MRWRGRNSASGREPTSPFFLRRQVHVLCAESSGGRLHQAAGFLVSLIGRMCREERLPLLGSGKCFWGLQQRYLWRLKHPEQLRGGGRLRLDKRLLPRRRLHNNIAIRMHESPKLSDFGDGLSVIAGQSVRSVVYPPSSLDLDPIAFAKCLMRDLGHLERYCHDGERELSRRSRSRCSPSSRSERRSCGIAALARRRPCC
jgi:hypothetical protein